MTDLGHLNAGMTLIVNVAAEVLGAYGIQIAKLLGENVTAIAGNPQTELLHSDGKDKVCNYNQISISDFSDT